MKTLLCVFGFLTLVGCSAETKEPCVNVDKLNQTELGTVIGEEMNKIYYDPDHFHRRTGDPEDYELIDLDDEENDNTD